MKTIITVTVLMVILMIGLNTLRSFDELRSSLTWRKIEKRPAQSAQYFSSEMVKDLPAPARRYFTYTILEGTELKGDVQIKMTGQLGLGPKEQPDYMDMNASQIMSFPEGFIWTVKTGRGPMIVTGSDGFYKDRSWSHFWLMHAVPIGRAGGHSKRKEDHRRAAFGRMVAEAAFWSPAALLPSENIRWEAVEPLIARATIRYDGLVQTVDITINETGQPIKVVIPRWSDSNPENKYKLQPFGGYLSVFKEFEGYRLPTHVEGGNFIGTDRYFPFYISDITALKFLDQSASENVDPSVKKEHQARSESQ